MSEYVACRVCSHGTAIRPACDANQVSLSECLLATHRSAILKWRVSDHWEIEPDLRHLPWRIAQRGRPTHVSL